MKYVGVVKKVGGKGITGYKIKKYVCKCGHEELVHGSEGLDMRLINEESFWSKMKDFLGFSNDDSDWDETFDKID
jgi:hypothetical protein